MEIVFSRLDDQIARFSLAGSTPAFANSFRRAMSGEVPTLAIEDVKIYDNTSALFDEMLAHRIGLIPIRTEEGCFVPRDACTCGGEGCPGCSVLFTMSVEGYLETRYIKIAQTMGKIDRVTRRISDLFDGITVFPEVEQQLLLTQVLIWKEGLLIPYH